MASKAIGFLNFKFGADLSGFERAMNKAQKKLNKFGKNIAKAGQNLSRNLTLPILALGAASIKAFDEQAKAETKLLTALKGREDVQQRLISQAKELQKTTLFGDEATIAAQSMLAMMGLTEEEIVKLIPLIQDFATAKGMDLVTAADLVAKSMGSSTNALSRYGIEITGAVGSSERLDTAVNQLTEKFEGQAEAVALIGAGPLIMMKNQLGDLGEELGERLMPYVQKFVDWMVDLIGKFDSLSESTKDNIVKWGLILAAIGPVLIIIGKVSMGLGTLVGGFKSVGKYLAANPWIAAAAAIAAVGYAIYDTFIATKELTTAQDDLDSISKTAQSSIMDEKVAVDLLTKELTAQGLSLEDKKIALDKLKKISPEYYGSLEIAKGTVEGLDQATQDYTASILKQAKAEAMREKLVELNIELLESEEKMQKFLATTGGFLGADLKGSDIEKRALKSLKESKQHIQDRIDALSKEYSITKKIGDLTTTPTTTTTTTPTTTKGETDKLVEATEALSLVPIDVSIWDKLSKIKMPDDLFNTDPMDKYRGALGMLGDEIAAFVGEDIESMEEGLASMVERMGDELAQGADSFQEYADNVKGMIKEVIGALISQGVAAAVSKALISAGTINPFLIPVIAGLAAGLARTAFNSLIPSFADGGIISGPTVGLMGEYPGASSNPEVVAPLDKLKSMMGRGTQNIVVEGVLRGSDIYLSNKNTSVNRLRTA